MTDIEDPWYAIESAVLALQENPSFAVYIDNLNDVRDEYERRHLGAAHANDPKGAVQYHLGYLAGLKDAIRRPDVVVSGEARKADKPTRVKAQKPMAQIPQRDNS